MNIVDVLQPKFKIRSRYNPVTEDQDKAILSYIDAASKKTCKVIIEQLLAECNKLKLEMKECEIEIVKAKNLIEHGKVEIITLSDASQHPIDFHQQGKMFLDYYTNKFENELGYQLQKLQQYLEMTRARDELLEKPRVEKVKIQQNERQRLIREAGGSGLTLSNYCKKMIYSALGGAYCQVCKIEDEHVLTFDHKNDDGHLDRKRFSSYGDFYLYYSLHIDEAREKLQVSCFNHNVKKFRISEKQLKTTQSM